MGVNVFSNVGRSGICSLDTDTASVVLCLFSCMVEIFCRAQLLKFIFSMRLSPIFSN